MVEKTLKWRDFYEEPLLIKEPVLYCTAKSKLGVLKNTLCYINGDTSKPFSGWKNLWKSIILNGIIPFSLVKNLENDFYKYIEFYSSLRYWYYGFILKMKKTD